MVPLANFLDKIFDGFDIKQLDNSSICLLGGSGFIGTWLVSSLNHLNNLSGCKIAITIYTRDSKLALEKFPVSDFPTLQIREFNFLAGKTDLGMFDFIVNASTPTSTKPTQDSKDFFYYPTLNAVDSIVHSVQKHKNITRVVNLSSGAVYGTQALSLELQPEGQSLVLSSEMDDYSAAKVLSEHVLDESESILGLRSISPRLFTFYGPGLPLDQHFAIGNFVSDALRGLPIRIQGNPETRRSYMFPTDLVNWILKALLDPRQGDFNIGSEVSISMLELATLVARLTRNNEVNLLNPNALANNYVPSTQNFRSAYNVQESVALEIGLSWWIDWLAQDKIKY